MSENILISKEKGTENRICPSTNQEIIEMLVPIESQSDSEFWQNGKFLEMCAKTGNVPTRDALVEFCKAKGVTLSSEQ